MISFSRLWPLMHIITASLFMINAAVADNFVQVSPPDFQLTQTSSAPSTFSSTLHLETAGNRFVRVQQLSWQSGAQPSFVTSPNGTLVGEVFSDGTPLDVTVELSFPSNGFYSDTLRITLACGDGDGCKGQEEQIVLVDFIARINCVGVDDRCLPKGPTCTLDLNTQHYVKFPNKTYSSSASEALMRTILKQGSGVSEFDVPLSDVAAFSGLSDLFQLGTASGCDCGQEIPPVHFVKSELSPIVSTFSWQSESGSPMAIPSNSDRLFDATLSLPGRISGIAVIGSSYVSLQFDTINTSPELELIYRGPSGDFSSGDTLYDGSILCIGATYDRAVVRNPMNGVSIPDMNLAIMQE